MNTRIIFPPILYPKLNDINKHDQLNHIRSPNMVLKRKIVIRNTLKKTGMKAIRDLEKS